jgi:hypothetical protein
MKTTCITSVADNRYWQGYAEKDCLGETDPISFDTIGTRGVCVQGACFEGAATSDGTTPLGAWLERKEEHPTTRRPYTKAQWDTARRGFFTAFVSKVSWDKQPWDFDTWHEYAGARDKFGPGWRAEVDVNRLQSIAFNQRREKYKQDFRRWLGDAPLPDGWEDKLWNWWTTNAPSERYNI